jgi:hypothetical protein
VSGLLHAPTTFTQGNSPRYPLDRRLGGPQSRSGQPAGVKILTPTRPRNLSLHRSACSQSLYRLLYPGSIHSGVEAYKATRDFTASIASAYRLSTSKITLWDINNDLPGLDLLLKHKQRLRKLWQEIRDPACKTAVNWVSKSIRRMTHKKALGTVGNKNM